MKFSIISLMILTLLIALSVHICFSWSRIAKCIEHGELSLYQLRDFREKTLAIKQRNIDSQIAALENESSQFKILQETLGKVFAEEVPAVSEITAREGMISILSIPLFMQKSEEKKLKVRIPQGRKLSLFLELQPTAEDESSAFAGAQWKPERSVQMSLDPGTYLIQWSLKFEKDSAKFSALVDGKEVVQFTWDSPQTNCICSGPGFPPQKDYAPKLLPLLRFKIMTGNGEPQVFISLSEPR